MGERRSNAYRFTVTDRFTDPRLLELREKIKAENKEARETGGDIQKISLFGRLGKDSPHKDNPRIRRRGYAGAQNVPIDLASRIDVYVHTRPGVNTKARYQAERDERTREHRARVEETLARDRIKTTLDPILKLLVRDLYARGFDTDMVDRVIIDHVTNLVPTITLS